MGARHVIIPIFAPHFGCPHTCAFCNQWNITQQDQLPTINVLKNTISEYHSLVKDKANAYIELAFFGGSFTGIDAGIQEALLSEANLAKQQGRIHAIRLSTRPDYIDELVLQRLLKYEVKTVELGVQSLDEEVLAASGRGHSAEDVIKAVTLLKNKGIQVGIQIMPGLPQDTKAKSLDTARKVVELQPNFVRIYPTLVLKGTELAIRYQKGIYMPWSLEKAIEVCKLLYILFSKDNIPIIRMGLQAVDNLNTNEDLVAGPYHPAFGELVESAVFLEQTSTLMGKCLEQRKSVILYCHHKDISKVVGMRRQNLNKIIRDFNCNVLVKGSDNIEIGNLAWGLEEGQIVDSLSREDFLNNYRI